jgi:hypothetical protein
MANKSSVCSTTLTSLFAIFWFLSAEDMLLPSEDACLALVVCGPSDSLMSKVLLLYEGSWTEFWSAPARVAVDWVTAGLEILTLAVFYMLCLVCECLKWGEGFNMRFYMMGWDGSIGYKIYTTKLQWVGMLCEFVYKVSM